MTTSTSSSAAVVPMAANTARYLLLGRLGFFGLWLLQPLWILWLAPPQLGNAYVLLALLWLPLWLPFYGIVKGMPIRWLGPILL